jgi:hypothetical protein
MDGIKPHKHMAGMEGSMDGAEGKFGVMPFHEVNGGSGTMSDGGHEGTKYGKQASLLGDGERGIGKPVGRGGGMMPAQRHPDHGPHHHAKSFGVASLKSEQQ